MRRRRPSPAVLAIGLLGLLALLGGASCGVTGSADDAAGSVVVEPGPEDPGEATTTTDPDGTTTTDPDDTPASTGDVEEPDEDEGDEGDEGDGTGGSGDAELDAYVDAVATMMSTNRFGVWDFAPEAVDCIAPGWTAALDHTRFLEKDIMPDDLLGDEVVINDFIDGDRADEMADAIEDCGVEITDFAAAQWTAIDGMPADQADCVSQTLALEKVRAYVTIAFEGRLHHIPPDGEFAVAFRAAMDTCA